MLIDIEPGLKITRYGYRKKKAINRILSCEAGKLAIRCQNSRIISEKALDAETITKPSFSNMRTGVRLFSSFLIGSVTSEQTLQIFKETLCTIKKQIHTATITFSSLTLVVLRSSTMASSTCICLEYLYNRISNN